jgi:indolepyruvate ferredoxin oxidoreductase
VRKLAGIAAQPWQPLDDLEAIIDDRCARLVAYQDEDYARQYRELVEHIRRGEQAIIAPAQELRLTKTVARNLYKLMAYKDEYEVARLYSDGKFKVQLQESFSGNFTLQFHLAPPALSKKSSAEGAGGRPPKYAMPGWFLTVFGQLAKLKFLRGTVFDPFGYTQERRTERELIPRYVATLQTLLAGLSLQNVELAIEIAALPQIIRGFGPVKAAAIERANAQQKTLLERFFATSRQGAAQVFFRAA